MTTMKKISFCAAVAAFFLVFLRLYFHFFTFFLWYYSIRMDASHVCVFSSVPRFFSFRCMLSSFLLLMLSWISVFFIIIPFFLPHVHCIFAFKHPLNAAKQSYTNIEHPNGYLDVFILFSRDISKHFRFFSSLSLSLSLSLSISRRISE